MWFVGVFSFIDYCRVWSTFPCVTQWILVTCFINSCCSVAQLCLTATPWTAACRLACPSLFPGVCSNSCPLHQWCHPTISSSIVPFSSCLQSFPASGSSHQVTKMLQEGGPIPGPEDGLLSNTRKWIFWGDTWQSKRFYWEGAPGRKL